MMILWEKFLRILHWGKTEQSILVIAHMGTICTESSGLDSKGGGEWTTSHKCLKEHEDLNSGGIIVPALSGL